MKSFEELSIPLQKKRIVKDALKQIAIGSISPNAGVYVRFTKTVRLKDSLQDIIAANENTCDCCAKGAIFASCVLNVDKVYGRDAYGTEEFIANKLVKWFTAKELDMIETAFERGTIHDHEKVLLRYKNGMSTKTPLGRKCIAFGNRYKNIERRLIAILNNVLENKVFTP